MSMPADLHSGAQVIADQARLATEAKLLSRLKTWAIATPTGAEIIDLDTDEHRRRDGFPPNAKSGVFCFTEPDSFCSYVSSHRQEARTTLYADRSAARIVAIFDDHRAGDDSLDDVLAGWGRHRAVLTLQRTPAWLAWTQLSGTPRNQLDFADFLEDHAADIREPIAAELLEIATTLQATSGAAMKSAIRLDNGQVQFRYEETIDARAGHTGTLQIPSRIALGLAPFDGVTPFRVEARLRYRLNSGSVSLTVLLDRPDDVERACFSEVLKAIATSTDLLPLHGTPPAI